MASFKTMLMKPNVKLGAKKPQLAIYAHVLAFLGSLISVVMAIIATIANFNILILLAAIFSIFIFVIEAGYLDLSFLKSPLIRGIVWIIIAVLSWQSGLIILISGILYIVYSQ